MPLFKKLNDILGVRFILNMNQIDLNDFVQSFIQACPFGADKCKIYNLDRDGYQGLHVYFRANNHAFTIEFQFSPFSF
ncbi:hypothetical protein SDC9_17179 [bioreactor metagenome]|uniref:RelA/SpoT domain-containing protein n=1 Tax=bioreactor metagenome TaxID=1076179 RepID=A0A644TWQ1_9ZZZZ